MPAATVAAPLEHATDVPARMVALAALAEVALTRDDTTEALRLAELNDDLARALRRAGQPRRLAELAEIFAGLTERDATRHNQAAMAVVRAELALAEGRAAEAAAEFRDVAELHASLPCPSRRVEALLGAAEASLASGDVTAAGATAHSAQAIGAQLGSPRLEREAAALLAGCEVDLVLATVLITDIVDSTTRAAAVGDRAWRATLERHHAIVRAVLQRHRGREVDTAGDGFLATFDSPARAIRCAVAAVDALAAAGIGVRAGLHTGECEVLGDKLAGIAVHTAARVASAAGSGEVLVSGTVRDLVAGSGFRFESRGTHALKGIPGDWPLFAVQSGAGD